MPSLDDDLALALRLADAADELTAAAFTGDLRLGERTPQLLQRLAAEHRREKQTVGFQRAADL